MTAHRPAILLLMLSLVACSKTPGPAAAPTSTPPEARIVDSTVPDTRVLMLSDSTEVWLVAGRVGRGPTGAPCLERGVQLRKGALKMPVPLLYTSDMPVVVDGKLIASLSTNCVSGQTYSIDLATAQPTKFERRPR